MNMTTISMVTTATPHADDGYTWRKYGSKPILGSKYPRSENVHVLCVKAVISTYFYQKREGKKKEIITPWAARPPMRMRCGALADPMQPDDR